MAKKKAAAKPVPTDMMALLMKELGSKNAQLMSDKTESMVPWRVPFSHHALQAATGGLIGGGIMQIEGESQSGKSFLMYELIANAIKMGGMCHLNDPEQAYEPAYGTKMGIGNSGFAYNNTNLLEPTFDEWIKFIKLARDKFIRDTSIPIIVAVDSFVPWRCLEQGKADDANKALGFGAMKKNAAFYDKLSLIQPILKDYSASLVILNQLRQDNTIMFGDKDKTQAEQVKYFLNQRLRGKLGKKIVRMSEIRDDDKKMQKVYTQTGMTTNWKTIKNRFVEPMKSVPVKILFRNGLQEFSGLEKYLLTEGEISIVEKPIQLKGGGEGKKMQEFLQPKGTDQLYAREELEKMVAEHPSLLEPKWTQKIDDTDYIESEEPEESEE